VLDFYRSTIGKKIIMAVTGLIWVGFVILHMAGNLQAFIGAEKLNNYAAMLHGPLEEVVLLQRVVLFVALVLHVLMAWQLTRRAAAARPVEYKMREPQVSTYSSRLMRWGGVILLVFIVLHILHFTTRNIGPSGFAERVDANGHFDVYNAVVSSFRIWWVTLLYVATMIFLGFHLWHGAWASIRTLGYAKPSDNPLKRRIAAGLATVVWVGFITVPIAVLLGIIR
jgi:succinate dehydrogenase / fumarate reductase, cytochrome b subunit